MGRWCEDFAGNFTQGSITVLHPPNDHPTTKGTNEGPPPRILSPKKEFFGFVATRKNQQERGARNGGMSSTKNQNYDAKETGVIECVQEELKWKAQAE